MHVMCGGGYMPRHLGTWQTCGCIGIYAFYVYLQLRVYFTKDYQHTSVCLQIYAYFTTYVYLHVYFTTASQHTSRMRNTHTHTHTHE